MNIKEQYKILEFGEYGDERGNLVVAEGNGKDIPFAIKRVFYMYGSDATVIRGQHANRKTEFVLIICRQCSGRICMIFPPTVCCSAWQANTMTAVNIFGTIMNI